MHWPAETEWQGNERRLSLELASPMPGGVVASLFQRCARVCSPSSTMLMWRGGFLSSHAIDVLLTIDEALQSRIELRVRSLSAQQFNWTTTKSSKSDALSQHFFDEYASLLVHTLLVNDLPFSIVSSPAGDELISSLVSTLPSPLSHQFDDAGLVCHRCSTRVGEARQTLAERAHLIGPSSNWTKTKKSLCFYDYETDSGLVVAVERNYVSRQGQHSSGLLIKSYETMSLGEFDTFRVDMVADSYAAQNVTLGVAM